MSTAVSDGLPLPTNCDDGCLPENLAVDAWPREYTATEHAHVNEVLRVLANVGRPGIFDIHR